MSTMVNRRLAHLRTLTVAEIAAAAHREGTTFPALVARIEKPPPAADPLAVFSPQQGGWS